MPTRFFIQVSLALTITLLAGNTGRTQPVTLRALTAQAESGQDVDIPIAFQGPPGIGALHLELVYDPAILECQSVEKGPLLAGNSLLESDTSQPGRIIIGAVSLDGIAGEGAILKARFVARGSAGQTTPLRLEHVQAWDGKTHVDVLAKVETGTFTVTEARRGRLLPFFAGIGVAVVLLSVMLAAVQARQKRRRA